MQTLVVASRKGGSGKSTLAAHLSVLAEAGGARVLLIDVDPQGSLHFWFQLRQRDTPEMIRCKPADLDRIVARARIEGVGFCIVDTPPHAEASILDAMRVADVLIVPTRPGPFDLAAVAATLDLAHDVGKAPLVVLNHTPPSPGWGPPAIVVEAGEAVRGMGAEVAGAFVTQRVAMAHAIISGQTVSEFEPRGKAAREIAALWNELHPRMENPANGPRKADVPSARLKAERRAARG